MPGNGCRLDLDRAQHVRQGHTVTSQVSQSKEREKMFRLAIMSASPQVNAAQALADVSRAIGEARVYTDPVESFEVKVQADTGHRQAAIDFLDGHEAPVSRSREQPIQADLQKRAVKAPWTEVERFEHALRAKVAEKAAGLDPATLEERIQAQVNADAARHQKLPPAPEWPPGRGNGKRHQERWGCESANPYLRVVRKGCLRSN